MVAVLAVGLALVTGCQQQVPSSIDLDTGFGFVIDPTQRVATLHTGGVPTPALDTQVLVSRTLVPDVDLSLDLFEVVYRDRDDTDDDLDESFVGTAIITARFRNATTDLPLLGLTFERNPATDPGVVSIEPAVGADDLGGDGVLSSGEATAELVFTVHHRGEPFVYVVDARAGIADLPPFTLLPRGGTAALDGDTLLLGREGTTPAAGEVFVFVRAGSGWTEQAILQAPDGGPFDHFGVAVALQGDTALVGGAGSAGDTGAVYVFTRVGASWSFEQKLTVDDATPMAGFGSAIALDGDVALIGAQGDESRGFATGTAYVFTRVGSSWTRLQRLLPADTTTGDQFGFSVALDGVTAVVGAVSDDDGGTNAGSAYVYAFDGASWTQRAKLRASDPVALANFGYSVAVNGDTILVGAQKDDDNGPSSGSSYVFESDGAGWTERAKLVPPDGSPSDEFGRAVAIDSGVALIQARTDDDMGLNTGSAYVYRRDGSDWRLERKLVPPEGASLAGFRRSIALDGNTALVAGSFTATVFEPLLP